jgi:hypothetical protein
MSTRRKFIATTIPLVAASTITAAEPAKIFRKYDGVDSAATKEAVKENLPFAQLWKEATFKEQQYLFALVELPADEESYIDLHGWIYNKSFKEWRRICLLKTRNLGKADLSIDAKKGFVILQGAANNELNKQEIFRFDLRATSDDAGYVR